MRPVRLLAFTLTVVTLAAALHACDSGNDSGDSPRTGGVGASAAAPSGPAPAATLVMPEAPQDKWSAAGDLCRVVTSTMAGKVLGHSGPITGQYTANMLPVKGGVDACTYTDATSPGFAANVVVMEATDDRWAATRKELTAGGKPIQEFSVTGTDGAFFGGNQAFARKGNLMAATNNSSLGRYDRAGLVRLTALAVTVTGK